MTALKKFNIKKMISKNRKVNKDQLSKVLERLVELEKVGIKRSEYDLTLPFSRRYVNSTENDDEQINTK